MKCVITLLVLAFGGAALGQSPSPAENPQTANWSKLGPTVEGSRGFTLSGRGIRLNPSGQYELWVKIVPTEPAGFVRSYGLPQGTSYVMQYATVDCGKKLLSLDKTAPFDSSNRVLPGRITGITPSSKRGTVRRGSIGETIFKYVCDEPAPVPVTPGH